jgi:hypothetical protein
VHHGTSFSASTSREAGAQRPHLRIIPLPGALDHQPVEAATYSRDSVSSTQSQQDISIMMV